MNLSNSAAKKAYWRFPGLTLLSVAIGTGTASAETFQEDGSTVTIEQSGSQGRSHSQIIRDKDGQTIITRDGNSTDITVQRRSGAPSPDDDGEPPPSRAGRFDRSWIERRFLHPAPDRGSADDCSESTESNQREAFKQQMLERLHRPPP